MQKGSIRTHMYHKNNTHKNKTMKTEVKFPHVNTLNIKHLRISSYNRFQVSKKTPAKLKNTVTKIASNFVDKCQKIAPLNAQRDWNRKRKKRDKN